MVTITFIINQKYSSLRKSEKKVADYLLLNQERAERMTIKELAKVVGVSQTTVVRFVKALNLESYSELRDAIVRERTLKREDYDNYQLFKEEGVFSKDFTKELPGKIIAKNIRSLEETLKNISIREYERAIKAIIEAENIVVFGVEDSNTPMYNLTTKLLYLGLNVSMQTDYYHQMVRANNMKKDDLAIGISYTGNSIQTIDVLKSAKNRGARILVITNSSDSKINEYSDISLYTASDQFLYGGALYSRVSQLAIIDMLYVGVIFSDIDKFKENMDQSAGIIRSKSYR